jgi:hypothetical protein
MAMNLNQMAASLDAADKPIEAAQAYEQVIASSTANLDTYVNLAVLYFVCNDGGYAAYHKLSRDFVGRAWDRAFELLDEAERRFGRKAEIDFWRKYFAFILLGEDPSYEEIEQLVQTDTTIIPYFHLLDYRQGRLYRLQAEQLLEQVSAGLTAKERYIRSVLKAGMLRQIQQG